MRWFDRVSDALAERGVSRATVGRSLGVTGQAVTLKLQGKRPVTVEELKELARWAGMSVAEAVGEDLVIVELRDEKDLVELYRLLAPEQQERILAMLRDLVGVKREG